MLCLRHRDWEQTSLSVGQYNLSRPRRCEPLLTAEAGYAWVLGRSCDGSPADHWHNPDSEGLGEFIPPLNDESQVGRFPRKERQAVWVSLKLQGFAGGPQFVSRSRIPIAPSAVSTAQVFSILFLGSGKGDGGDDPIAILSACEERSTRREPSRRAESGRVVRTTLRRHERGAHRWGLLLPVLLPSLRVTRMCLKS